MPSMGLAHVSLNMFSTRLVNIDLSGNRLECLPEEIGDI